MSLRSRSARKTSRGSQQAAVGVDYLYPPTETGSRSCWWLFERKEIENQSEYDSLCNCSEKDEPSERFLENKRLDEQRDEKSNSKASESFVPGGPRGVGHRWPLPV